MARQVSERTLLFLLGAVQFVNVLDFMMVMPLGPDFAAELGIATSRLGLVGGSYTAAAAVAGVAGSLFLDRFDRRSALFCAMTGLVVATAAGGFAWDLRSMLAARVLAGLFGGPATSLTVSIIADAIPPQRRGKAMGAVMGAFSIASVLGVPAGLELGRLGGWRTPFFAVAATGVAVALGSVLLMPPLRGHLAARAQAGPPGPPFWRVPAALIALGAMGTAMMAGFSIIPNISAFVQFNLGYPRERVGLLYMGGGAVSFATMRLAGRLVDRFGSPAVAAGATVLYLATVAFGFGWPRPGLPVVALFIGFMVSNSSRNIAANALTSRVPDPAERARFASTQSAVQHLASAAGAVLSSQWLTELPDRSLAGMERLAVFAMALALVLPLALVAVERQVRAREAARARQSSAPDSTTLATVK